MILSDLPKKENKKQYSTKLKQETLRQLQEISTAKGISKAVLIEHLVEVAYQEFIKEQNQK